jgi:hypothetical protein
MNEAPKSAKILAFPRRAIPVLSPEDQEQSILERLELESTLSDVDRRRLRELQKRKG